MSTSRKALTFDLDRAPAAPVPPAAAAPARRQATKDARQLISTRVTPDVYRQLKVRAVQKGEKVQDLVEQAITEFLANHPV